MTYLLICLAFIGLDQLVKNWAFLKLALVDTIPVISGFFHLTYAENIGAAFSILKGARWFFVIMATIFAIVVAVLFKKNFFKPWWSKLGAALVVAGALGNAIDRARYGFVVDMFDLRAINFPIFNVADLLITAGGILCGVYILFFEGKKNG